MWGTGSDESRAGGWEAGCKGSVAVGLKWRAKDGPALGERSSFSAVATYRGLGRLRYLWGSSHMGMGDGGLV